MYETKDEKLSSFILLLFFLFSLPLLLSALPYFLSHPHSLSLPERKGFQQVANKHGRTSCSDTRRMPPIETAQKAEKIPSADERVIDTPAPTVISSS